MEYSKVQSMPYLAIAPRFIEIMLVLTLAWLVAGWLITPVVLISTIPTTVHHASSDASGVSVRALLAMAPFGKSKTKTSDMKVRQIRVVAPSRRAMILQGTVVAGKDSVAMIVPRPGAKPGVFHVDECILPGVKLKRVESKRVFIEAGHKTEVLMLAGVKAGSVPAPFMPSVVSGASKAVRDRNISRIALDRELNDFPRLLSQARVVPEIQGGKNIGFRLGEIVSGSLYDRIGLKNGDIVQTVNGVRIQNPSQAMAMYQQLKDASSVAVELLRNGQPQTLNYNIR